MSTVRNDGIIIIIIRVYTLFPWHTKRIFHSMSSSSWLTRWLLHCLLLLYCPATEYSPEQDLLLLYCTATEQGPVQGSSVTAVLCQRTRPSKGVRLGPNTEDFSYCTMSPLIRAQYRVFYYCTVLPRDEGPVQGLSVTVVCYQRNGPTKAAFWYIKALPCCNSQY